MAGSMVAKTEPGRVGISPEAKKIRDLKLAAYWEGWIAFQLTGTRANTTTGFGAWSNDGTVDIAARAAAYEKPGENPYNSFLGSDSRPLFPVYPEVCGVYMGAGLASINAADPNELQQVIALIAEHSTLELRGKTYGRACFQPVVTLPPGIGIPTFTTDSFRYFEQHGALSKEQMFRLPADVAFSTDEKVTALLKIDSGARTALAALAGSFPSAGAVIAVRLIGTAEYQVQGGRG